MLAVGLEKPSVLDFATDMHAAVNRAHPARWIPVDGPNTVFQSPEKEIGQAVEIIYAAYALVEIDLVFPDEPSDEEAVEKAGQPDACRPAHKPGHLVFWNDAER